MLVPDARGWFEEKNVFPKNTYTARGQLSHLDVTDEKKWKQLPIVIVSE